VSGSAANLIAILLASNHPAGAGPQAGFYVSGKSAANTLDVFLATSSQAGTGSAVGFCASAGPPALCGEASVAVFWPAGAASFS